jgi:hypothetical protein
MSVENRYPQNAIGWGLLCAVIGYLTLNVSNGYKVIGTSYLQSDSHLRDELNDYMGLPAFEPSLIWALFLGGLASTLIGIVWLLRRRFSSKIT